MLVRVRIPPNIGAASPLVAGGFVFDMGSSFPGFLKHIATAGR